MHSVQAERTVEQSHCKRGGKCNGLKHSKEEKQHKKQDGHLASGTHSPAGHEYGGSHGNFFQSIKTKVKTKIEKIKKEFRDHDKNSSSSDSDDDRATNKKMEKKGHVKAEQKGHQGEK